MAVRRSKEIEIDCRDSLSYSIHQFFPCLKSVSDQPPTICKFILEYPEEVEYVDCSIEKEFNEWFKSHLSHDRDQAHDIDGGISDMAQLQERYNQLYSYM